MDLDLHLDDWHDEIGWDGIGNVKKCYLAIPD
jgi:hypothetical protein